jgi:putative FmdB family regulatory protein
MPIYAYRCATCGHAKDVLQKISDPVLTVCPNCGAATFQKQVTAAGFQLKGSGWYVTDFRDGQKPKGGDKSGGEKGAEKAGETAGEKAAGDAKTDAKGSAGDAPAAAPAASSGEAAKPAGTPSPAAPSSPAPSSGAAK